MSDVVERLRKPAVRFYGQPVRTTFDELHEEAIAEIERLRGALTKLCDVVAEDEEHGDGAYDSNCRICVVHAECRALLSDKGGDDG